MYFFVQVFISVICLTRSVKSEFVGHREFPEDFKFGIASSAYQIEGAWNENGKGESIWDRYVHEHPEIIKGGANGDIACDSYHKTAEDVALLKDMGIQFYRFSLSWSRILPTGFTNYINPDGIRYYNELIDELLSNGIEPMVTLYHWDLPQRLQELGGWPNRALVEHYVNYARIAFENFGDRVKTWITFNESKFICKSGYGHYWMAPGFTNSSGIADYQCAHTVLLAHAKAYHLYDKQFRDKQKGKIGFTLDTEWFTPNSTSPEDKEAARRMIEFDLGWFANPIYSKEGDYPQIMKDRIAERSFMEGFPKSRLPVFTPEEVKYVRGTSDFFGFNHYTSDYVSDAPEAPANEVSYINDMRATTWKDPSWPVAGSDWLTVVPQGFRESLKYIKEKYGDPEIYVTENGYSDLPAEMIDDPGRSDYHKKYLQAMLEAIYLDGVNVKMYAAWTFLDDFEWIFGYAPRFGFYHVDFTDPKRPRTPKTSVEVYKKIIQDRSLKSVLNFTKDGKARKDL